MRGMKAPSNGFDARALGGRRVCSRSRGDMIRLKDSSRTRSLASPSQGWRLRWISAQEKRQPCRGGARGDCGARRGSMRGAWLEVSGRGEW